MTSPVSCAVELTPGGYLVIAAEVARTFFPNDTLLVFSKARELWLLPTRGAGGGGLLLKQRNPDGDRAVLVREVLGDALPVGKLPAIWDDAQGALRVALVAGATVA
jgi:hydrogenase maturation protease